MDITGDSGHADLHTASGFMPSEMVTHAYLLNKDRKNVRTFASYEVNDELSVFVEGINLTEEHKRIHGRSSYQLREFAIGHARYNLGVRYAF